MPQDKIQSPGKDLIFTRAFFYLSIKEILVDFSKKIRYNIDVRKNQRKFERRKICQIMA